MLSSGLRSVRALELLSPAGWHMRRIAKALRCRTSVAPGQSVFDVDRQPRVAACRGNGEYGDEDEQDGREELDDCEGPDLEDEPFDPEPTDEEIWDDFQWEDRSDDDLPPPEELWSDADWE